MRDIFFRNTNVVPDNFSNTRSGRVDYRKITLYDNKIVIKNLNTDKPKVRLGVCTGKKSCASFRQFIKTFNFRDTFFYGEIKSRDPFLTVDDSLQLHLSRKDLEYAEFPIVNLKDDTYLIIITESDFEVDVHGVELLRSGKVVSNRIIDLRTPLTSPDSENTTEEFSLKGINAHVDSFICSSAKGYIEGAVVLNAEALIAELVKYKSLINPNRLEEMLREVHLSRSVVLTDLSHPLESDSLEVKLEPLKLNYDKAYKFYGFKDSQVYRDQSYQYRLRISVEDLTPMILSNALSKANSFVNMITDIESSSTLALQLDAAIDALSDLLSVAEQKGLLSEDIGLLYRLVNQETDIDAEILERIASSLRSLIHSLKNDLLNQVNLYGSNSSTYNLSRFMEQEIVLDNIRKNASKEQTTASFIESRTLSRLPLSDLPNVAFTREATLAATVVNAPPRTLTGENLQVRARSIGTLVEKLAERVNIGLCAVEEAVTQTSSNNSNIEVFKTEKLVPAKISYLAGFHSSSKTNFWKPLTNEVLDDIIKNDLSYLFRVDGSDLIENKFFLSSE